MPRIALVDPWGTMYEICTGRVETTLWAWFDEILPIVNKELGERDIPAARIRVQPLWWGNEGPDWIADSRVTGRWEKFPAYTAEQGIGQLALLRIRLETELRAVIAERGR